MQEKLVAIAAFPETKFVTSVKAARAMDNNARYKMQVSKIIYVNVDRTQIFDHLYAEMELPFVPFIGLAIHRQNGRSCDAIESLTWDDEKHLCLAESHAEAGDHDRSAEDIRDWDMQYCGWLSHKKTANL